MGPKLVSEAKLATRNKAMELEAGDETRGGSGGWRVGHCKLHAC